MVYLNALNEPDLTLGIISSILGAQVISYCLLYYLIKNAN